MKSVSNFNLYLFSLFVLLTSNSLYVTFPQKYYFYIASVFIICWALFFDLIILRTQSNKKGNMSKKSTLFLIAFLLLILTYITLHIDYWQNNKGLFFQFFVLFFVFIPIVWIYFSIFGYRRFLIAFTNVLCAICVISLLLWIGMSVTHLISPSGYVTSYWSSNSAYLPTFHHIYFETQNFDFLGFRLVRNSSIWPEAPMYAMVLSFGLLSEIYLTVRKSKIVVFIIALTLLTTLTTSGIIVLSLLTVDFLIEKNKKISNFKMEILFLTVSLILGFFLMIIIYLSLNLKLSSASGSIRLDDYIVGYNSFLESPWIGHGFKNVKYLMPFMDYNIRGYWENGMLIYNTGIANGWTQVFSDGGLLMGLIYLISFMEGIFSRSKSRNFHKFFFILFILMFILILNYSEMFLIFMVISLVDFGNRHDRLDNNLNKKLL